MKTSPKFLLIISFFCLLQIQTGYAQTRSGDTLLVSRYLIDAGITLHDSAKYKEAIEKYSLVSPNDTAYSEALYEKILSYRLDSNYTKAIETGLLGLELNLPNKLNIYTQLANTYDDAGMIDKAIETYHTSLKEFPVDACLYHEMGVTYSRMKNDTAAVRAYAAAIKIDPLYAPSHLRLGFLAAKNNHFVPALLSFQIFLVIENTSSRSLEVLKYMDELVKGDFKINKDSITNLISDSKAYSALEDIIHSKSALVSAYKTNIKLPYLDIVKSLQIISEKLEFKNDDNDIWMQIYVPFYISMRKQGYFQPFVYYLFNCINKDVVTEQIKANKAAIEKMIAWVSEYFASGIPNGSSTTGIKKLQTRFFGNGHIKNIGYYDPKLKLFTGYYKSYSIFGLPKSEGNFNEKGLENGEWKYYYTSGQLVRVRNFANGKYQGNSLTYYRNGQLAEKSEYVNDLREGNYQTWYPTGVLKAEGHFKAGMKNGSMKNYDKFGNLLNEGYYVMNKYDSVYAEYFINGKKSMIATFAKGKRAGLIKKYYFEGNIDTEGTMSDDNSDGVWKYYYRSGKIRKTGAYKMGKEEGLWKEFFENGQVSSELNYANGILNGKHIMNDEDGKIMFEAQYTNGVIKQTKCYDKTGKVVSSEEDKHGTFQFNLFHPDGITKAREGKLINGKEEGLWSYYFANGKKSQEKNYKNGVLEGESKTFYGNGMLQKTYFYHNGELHGKYEHIYKNGNMCEEGFYKNGDKAGPWISYNASGTITDKKFFNNGELAGFYESFDDYGHKNIESFYDEESIVSKINQYDTLGSILNTIEVQKGSGPYKSLHLNKKTFHETQFKSGSRDGIEKFYYADGTLFRESFISNGDYNGKYIDYHQNGKIKAELFYINDERDSVDKRYFETGELMSAIKYSHGQEEDTAKWYYRSGNISKEGIFVHGEYEGYVTYYAPDGTVRFRYLQKSGTIIGYSYLDKDGKFITDIPVVGETIHILAYYPNGNKSAEFDLVGGYLEGERNFYYSNGNIQYMRNYKNDELEGTAKEFYENGVLKSEENYFYDELDGTSKYFAENGVLTEEIQYKSGNRNGLRTAYDSTNGAIIKSVIYYNNQPYE